MAFHKIKDLKVSALGPQLDFNRIYISRGSTQWWDSMPQPPYPTYNPLRPLGQNWWHNYEVRIEIPPENPGDVLVIREADLLPSYHVHDPVDPHPDLWYGNAGGWTWTLERRGDKLVRFFFDGSFQEFAPPLSEEEPGRLLRVCDARGLCQILSYGSNGKLARVTDERTGRALIFEYQQDSVAEHLTRVAGPTGEVRFEYEVGWGIDDQPGCSGPEDHPCNDVRLARVIREDRIERYSYDYRNLTHGNFYWNYVLFLDRAEYCDNVNGAPENCREVSHLEYGSDLGEVRKFSRPADPARGLPAEDYTFGWENPETIFDYQTEWTTHQTVTDPEGNAVTYTVWNGSGKPKIVEVSGAAPSCCGLGNLVSRSYNWANQVIEQVDARGYKTVLNYGLGMFSRRLSVTEGVSASDPSGDRETNFSYVSSQVTNAGYTRSFLVRSQVSVADGKTTVYDFDPPGNPDPPNQSPTPFLSRLTESGLTDTNGDGVAAEPQAATTVYTYQNGLVKTISGPAPGSLTTYTYAANGDVRTVAQAIGRRSLVTRLSSYTPNGQPGSVLDPNGNETRIEYDSQGRVKREIKTYGGQQAVTESVFDLFGNLVRAYLPRPGTGSFSVYDSRNRLTETRSGAGEKVKYTHDVLGRKTREEYVDPQGAVVRTVSFAYDNPNDDLADPRSLWKVTEGSSTTESFYDAAGNRTKLIDGEGKTIEYTFDGLRRVKTVIQGGATTTYGYAPRGGGNLETVTDAEGHVTAYSVDDFGRVMKVTSPDTGAIVYNYGPAGDLALKKDARGTSTAYAYDALNRLLSIARNGGSADDLTFTYDEGGASQNGKGRLTTVEDAQGGKTKLTYDSDGRLASETRKLPSVAQAITSLAYDLNGNLSTLTYPGGRAVGYTYDLADRPVSVASGAETLASGITYEPFGPMKAFTYGNGIQTTSTHGLFYQTTSIQTSPSVFSRDYTLYGNGNIQSITDGAETNSFTYDGQNRIETSSVGIGSLGPFDYSYDRVGNRGSENSTPYSYAPGANKIATAGTLSFQHDANGNMTSETDTGPSRPGRMIPPMTLGYNLADRLATVSRDNLTFQYSYDYQARRTTKRMPGIAGPNAITRAFYYDSSGNMLSEMDRNGNVIADYVYVNGQRIARMGIDPAGDSDGDGMPNLYEEKNNLLVFNDDANRDLDGDGRTNLQESSVQSDPFDPDTDNDGYTDEQEASAGTNPLDPTSYPGSGGGASAKFPVWTKNFDIQVGPNPKMCARGDFDGDGNPDLAVADTGSYMSGGGSDGVVHILMGDPQGRLDVTGTLTDVGKGPLFVAPGDFNNDGYEDLAVSRAGNKLIGGTDPGGLVIYLGNGTGQFTRFFEYTQPGMPTPYALVVGDFDGDTDADIASADTGLVFNFGPTGFESVGNLDQSTVSIYLNDGTGRFSPRAPIDLGDMMPVAIVAGDLVEDVDGILDLAVTTNALFQPGPVQGGVHILQGDGLGGFARVGGKIDVGARPFALWTGQMNADSHLDLVVSRTAVESAVKVLLGDGLGGFTQEPEVAVGEAPASIAGADFNEDGKTDFLVPSLWPSRLNLLFGDGLGGLSLPSSIPTSQWPRWAEAADFDSDRYEDAAVVTDLADIVQVLFGQGNGTFWQPKQIVTNTSPFQILSDRFDGGSVLDLAILHQQDQQISVYLGQGGGAFPASATATVATGENPYSFSSGEFNRDGKKDLVWTNAGLTSFQIAYGNGAGAFSAPSTIAVPNASAVFVVQALDWDGDGKDDVALGGANGTTGQSGLTVLKQGGGGQFTKSKEVWFGNSDSITDIAMADFQEGGKAEFAVLQYSQGSGAGQIQIVKRAGGDELQVLSTFPIRNGTRPFSLAIADFDKDTHADLAVANSQADFTAGARLLGPGSVSVFFGDGNGAFSAEMNFSAGYGPMAIEAVDLNGDTWPDLAIATLGRYFFDQTPDFGGLQVLISDGFRGFIGPQGTATGVFPIGLASGDFDANGTNDVAVSNVASKTVSIMLNFVEQGAALRKRGESGEPEGLLLASLKEVALPKAKAAPAADPTYYFHFDHLGAPWVMTDANRQVVWAAYYEPFGKAHIATEQVVSNFRTPGQYEDRESGRSYDWWRYYTPTDARFLSPDPVLFSSTIAQGLIPNDGQLERRPASSPYGYALNDPINWFDQNGEEPRSGGPRNDPLTPDQIRKEWEKVRNDPSKTQREKQKAKKRWEEAQRRPSKKQQPGSGGHHLLDWCGENPGTCAAVGVGGAILILTPWPDEIPAAAAAAAIMGVGLPATAVAGEDGEVGSPCTAGAP